MTIEPTINDIKKSIEETNKTWIVWVGGDEVNESYLSHEEAKALADTWIEKGYDEVAIQDISSEQGSWDYCGLCSEHIESIYAHDCPATHEDETWYFKEYVSTRIVTGKQIGRAHV